MQPKLTPKELHPSIFDAFDKFELGIYTGDVANSGVMSKHQEVWFKAYGKSLLLAIAGWTIALAGIVTAANITGINSIGKIGGVLWITGVIAHCAYGYLKNRRTATLDEIEALLPALEITPVQLAYCQAMISAYKSPFLSELERDEVRVSLTQLMEQADQLEQERKNGDFVESGKFILELKQELVDCQAQLREAKDAELSATLQQTHSILETRISRLEGRTHVYGRVEAQLELIRQTFLSFREGFGQSIRRELSAHHTSGELRTLLQSVRSQTDAVASAIQEIHQVSS